MNNSVKCLIVIFFIFNAYFLYSLPAQSGTIPSFERTDYTLSFSSYFISVNDINNDGNSDIISVPRFGPISFFIGNGDGTFQNEIKFNFKNDFINYYFLPGDYNNDGNIDFVLNDRILFGDGNGNFLEQEIDMGTGYTGTGDFNRGASGDINGDGYLDLIVSANLTVLINNGDGTFKYKNFISPDDRYQILSLCDYTGDGYPDLIMARPMDDFTFCNVYFCLGNGNGTFGEITSLLEFYPYTYYYSPDSKDFNGDGISDFIVCLGERGHLFLYGWDKNASFSKLWGIDEWIHIDGSAYNFIYNMDIDNDANNDVVVLSLLMAYQKDWLSYYPGNGDGTFGDMITICHDLPKSFNMAYGDLNKDRRIDFTLGTTDSLDTPGLSVFISKSNTGVEDEKPSEENILNLSAYPNPFNPSTTINYQLFIQSFINVEIYDILGRKVKTLLSRTQMPGNYTILWKGDDEYGNNLSSGLYICTVKNDFRKILKAKKLMLMK